MPVDQRDDRALGRGPGPVQPQADPRIDHRQHPAAQRGQPDDPGGAPTAQA